MRQRIFALTGYFLRSVFTSLAGIVYIVVALAYWVIFFPPQQQTPDVDNYILIIGAFGVLMAFLITLTIAARANESSHYPLVVRLPSKVEYLTAVILSSLIATMLLQVGVALLALYRGPTLTWTDLLDIPPVWIAVNTLAAVLAVHASDFVTNGWSRVYVFSVLAIFLFGQNLNDSVTTWLADRVTRFSGVLMGRNFVGLSDLLSTLAKWLNSEGAETLRRVFGLVFWPFRAIANAVIDGAFSPTQALAPAIILLYAAILFMLAADLFATKDLDFTE